MNMSFKKSVWYASRLNVPSSMVQTSSLVQCTVTAPGQKPVCKNEYWCICSPKRGTVTLQNLQQSYPKMSSCRFISNKARAKQLTQTYPILEGQLMPILRHVFEANLRNTVNCKQRYTELMEKVNLGGGHSAIQRHTQRNRKLLVRDRLRLLLDDDDFLELSPFAGFGMPYGDVPSAGCVNRIGKINGVWCMITANDATVKGGTSYPITVTKQLRSQEVAVQNKLPTLYVVDSGGAFLPLQAEIFPDKHNGGRAFYNEAIMSAMKIPQVSIVAGSCTAGGAYVPTMAEETIIVNKIGTIFLGGPPLVKAAIGEEVSPEDLGGAALHSKVSGCVDHFAASETEAYQCARNIISTLNFTPEPEDNLDYESPLYSAEELAGLAPRDYNHTLNVKLILSRLIDGSRFLEFKAEYGMTLVTGFAWIKGHLVGIIANNGELSHDAALKGSHFIQLCDQRGTPLLFLQNTAHVALTATLSQAEANTNRLKAQASMMTAVACASVPKITVVIGGCCGGESYAMCGRSFSPSFLFLWPNARTAIMDPSHSAEYLQMDENDIPRSETEIRQLRKQSLLSV
ncbi:biotin-dependent 3-methylcrotonyl-coenzyme A carboxylase beta1 subunit-like isoform X2 [Protopterus annectens]|uniref:biotin-dependent 3-methylcrotonyl-coenzyme A carboxylase beta1 subunit-like isoform X2 n=1 Tax=Protopterus annectens TaxID=7888 RepID=UPI001CFA3A12|nr:biotin-dependent 3-methylcrotonyl-coenzyme A carboxylase beta1 subunit-like isoform X2 [Protopterus annectens]